MAQARRNIEFEDLLFAAFIATGARKEDILKPTHHQRGNVVVARHSIALFLRYCGYDSKYIAKKLHVGEGTPRSMISKIRRNKERYMLAVELMKDFLGMKG